MSCAHADWTPLQASLSRQPNLRSGTVDVIVADWLWVSRERSLGANLVFYPYSSTLGAIMVQMPSSIRNLAGSEFVVAIGKELNENRIFATLNLRYDLEWTHVLSRDVWL